MEIRTLTAQERMQVATLLGGWRLAERWSAGDRFRQQAKSDPSWHHENVFVALEHRGNRSHPMDEAKARFRCVNPVGFASRLDVDLFDGEDGAAFLRRILPPDAMVFWPADRF